MWIFAQRDGHSHVKLSLLPENANLIITMLCLPVRLAIYSLKRVDYRLERSCKTIPERLSFQHLFIYSLYQMLYDGLNISTLISRYFTAFVSLRNLKTKCFIFRCLGGVISLTHPITGPRQTESDRSCYFTLLDVFLASKKGRNLQNYTYITQQMVIHRVSNRMSFSCLFTNCRSR